MTSLADTDVVAPITPEQRAEFERNGFLVIPGALSESEVGFYADAIDRVYAAEKAAGRLSPDGAMHLLSAVTNCPDAAGLTDHPRTFPLVWSMLAGTCTSTTPTSTCIPRSGCLSRSASSAPGRRPAEPRLETDPRAAAFGQARLLALDVSEIGRGNLKVIPGSHMQNWIDGPPRRDIEWPEPPDASRSVRNR